MQKLIFWMGPVPEHCDITYVPITDKFIDGVSHAMHAWAIMHPDAHKEFGDGLGTGKGQEYTKQADGRWLKTAG